MMKDPMRPTADDPLVISVGIQHDGAAYELHPRSQRRIEEKFPGLKLLPVVFLGHRRASEFDTLQPPRWKQMALLLTGLTEEQIAEMGGVVLYSPEREQVLWEWEPAPATRQG
jgi:hypothetical protein